MKSLIYVLSALAVFGLAFWAYQENYQTQSALKDSASIMREIGELFEVKDIPHEATEIPDDIDILLIVHPKKYPDPLLHAIDTYVMGGGAAVVCEDPLCEADMPPGAQQNPTMLMQADRSSNLNALLTPWGVTMDTEEIVVDLDHAMRGPSRSGGNSRLTTLSR